MNFNGIFNDSQPHRNLLAAAGTYLAQGMAVIPVRQNKVAAVPWKAFQSQLPTPENLPEWFASGAYPALGIICGSLSRLIVLDFDTAAAFDRFLEQHPDLTHTLTVKTWRGWHLWYRASQVGHLMRSRQGNGVDLLAEGKYAIAPPSTINGHRYEVVADQPIHELTPGDIRRLEAFVVGDTPRLQPITETRPISTAELQGLYRAQAQVGSRNNSLFHAALESRDAGWSVEQAVMALADLHVQHGRVGENPLNRQREALATIQSAFSRPPRLQTAAAPGLPNLVRESLHGLKLTCAVRLLEALYQRGYCAGQLVHPETLWHDLGRLIGRHSIYKALKATLPDGTRLFEYEDTYENPSLSTLTPEASAIDLSQETNTKCCVSGRKNRQKVKKGRPTRCYRLPSIAELCRKLGLPASRTSDVLPSEALHSAKSTRQVTHLTLFKRRPGQYGRDLLAKRLGVGVRTIDSYNKALKQANPDFHKRHRFIETPLFWNNLGLIPPEDMGIRGVFLMDDEAKKYPAKPAIAHKLLRAGRRVSLLRQTWNEYWIGSRFSPPSLPGETLRQPQATATLSSAATMPRLAARTPVFGDLPQSAALPSPQAQMPFQAPVSVSKPDNAPAHNPRRKFPDEHLEGVTETIQRRINALSANTKHHLSRRTVRGLLVVYGEKAVKRAVFRIEERHNVENAAGFLIVMLRSNANRPMLRQLLGQLTLNGRKRTLTSFTH